MNDQQTRRGFLKSASALAVAGAAVAAVGPTASTPAAAALAQESAEADRGPCYKVSLNAYSFSKALNDFNKRGGGGISLMALLDFCAKNGFDGIDATGYFFPTYPEVPPNDVVNNFKRKAFGLGLGISGTGVRNNFTTSDKAERDAAVKHIKEWVEVAARMGAPVLRVFADTQMKAKSWQDVAPGLTRDAVQTYIVDALAECTEQGKKYGVIIGVQNHGDFLQTADQHMALVNAVKSEWCGPIVDTGYYKTPDPYKDIAQVAPHAVNWQIKERPFGQENDTPTDLVKLMKIIRASGYRGYLPIETLSKNKDKDKEPGGYDPFTVVPAFVKQFRDAIEQTA
jgi:sugar phosphate isomerase/epimerase